MRKIKTSPKSQTEKNSRHAKSTEPLKKLSAKNLFQHPRPEDAVTEWHVRVHPALQHHFGYCLYKVAMQMRYLLDRALAGQGITTTHFGILRLLKLTGEQNQVSLCESLTIDRASMVKLLDGLEKVGLVERRECPKDRRAKMVRLTPKGMPKADLILKMAGEIETQMMERLTPQERVVLRKAVPKLLDFSLGKTADTL